MVSLEEIRRQEALYRERRRRARPPSPPVYNQEEAQRRTLEICTAIFRSEALSKRERKKGGTTSTYVEKGPPVNRTWTLWYRHPLDGLRGILAKQDLRQLQYLPPEARMHNAVAKNNPYMVEELALAGNPVNSRNATGFTPLHVACYYDFSNCVSVLLDVGADMNAVSDAGFTPLFVATKSGAFTSAIILRQAGAKMEVPLCQPPGVRTCLDLKLPAIGTVAVAQAAELKRRPYKRDF